MYSTKKASECDAFNWCKLTFYFFHFYIKINVDQKVHCVIFPLFQYFFIVFVSRGEECVLETADLR